MFLNKLPPLTFRYSKHVAVGYISLKQIRAGMETGLRGMAEKTQGKELREPGSGPRRKVPREEMGWKERHLQAGYHRTK